VKGGCNSLKNAAFGYRMQKLGRVKVLFGRSRFGRGFFHIIIRYIVLIVGDVHIDFDDGGFRQGAILGVPTLHA